MTTTNTTTNTLWTAAFADGGAPYYPEGDAFASKADLLASLKDLTENLNDDDAHKVTIGTVQADEDGGWRWTSFEADETVTLPEG